MSLLRLITVSGMSRHPTGFVLCTAPVNKFIQKKKKGSKARPLHYSFAHACTYRVLPPWCRYGARLSKEQVAEPVAPRSSSSTPGLNTTACPTRPSQ